MSLHEDVLEILVSEEEISEKCIELGRRITEDYKDKKPILIGLLKGSVPFMATLIKNITCDMQIDFMSVSSYSGTTTTGMVHVSKDVSCDVKNRHVIIVEDIIDTGYTMQRMVTQLRDLGAKEVYVSTLLRKPNACKVPDLQVDYAALEIPNDFIVGYGLDYDEEGRNLPDIYVIKE